jgi:hypothetical protein
MSPGTVAPNLGHGLHHLAQGRCCRLGLALLVVAEPGVEQGQQDQANAGHVLVDQEADDRRSDEHDLHVFLVLLEEALPDRHRLGLGQGIRTVRLEPLAHLGRAQAAGRIDLEPGGDLIARQGVPAVVRRRRGGSPRWAGRRGHETSSFWRRPGSRLDSPWSTLVGSGRNVTSSFLTCERAHVNVRPLC